MSSSCLAGRASPGRPRTSMIAFLMREPNRQAAAQRVRVRVGGQAGRDRRVERLDGPRRAQGLDGVAVQELQELDGPLHVGQAAGSELEVQRAVGAARDPLRFHPRLEPPDLAHGRLAEAAGRVPELVGERDELRPEVRVADRELGPQQRLPLPRRGPALVVGPARGEAADQRALLALGAQVRVHQQGRVGRGEREQAAQLGADRLRRVRRPAVAAPGPGPGPGRAAGRARRSRRRRCRSRIRARRSGPSRSPRTGSAAGRPAPSRSSRSRRRGRRPGSRW